MWEGDLMRIPRRSLCLLASLPAIAPARTALPPDIDPVTLSRLPPGSPRTIWTKKGGSCWRHGRRSSRGPDRRTSRATAPGSAGLGIPSGVNSPVGPRLLPAGGADHRARNRPAGAEWSAHEPAGLRQGLEQSVIDVVNYNRDVAGLSDKDATLITFGRTLYREHKVSSALWQKMVGLFGRQQTVQLMMIMGDYFRVGFMMNAVDQHLPAERKALLPPLNR